MPRPLPYPKTVFALDYKLLSESYQHFDSTINKFGPERGKYIAALPESLIYRKLIAEDLVKQLGPQSVKYLRARVRLLPQGGQHSPYFYPFNYLDLKEMPFIKAATQAIDESLVHYLLLSNVDECKNVDPSDFVTNEVQILAQYGHQENVIPKLCQLLDPIIYIHDVLHYVDPHFSVTSNQYISLWKEIFSHISGKRTIHIHTEKEFTIAEFKRVYGDYIHNGISVEIHIYEKDRRNHDRLFVGANGGWKSGRGFQLSTADSILLDFTAVGPGPGGIDARLQYLKDINECSHFLYPPP